MIDETMKNNATNDDSMVLRTEGLIKKYGKRTVVNGVSFEVKQAPKSPFERGIFESGVLDYVLCDFRLLPAGGLGVLLNCDGISSSPNRCQSILR
jgi:hypothetical protein